VERRREKKRQVERKKERKKECCVFEVEIQVYLAWLNVWYFKRSLLLVTLCETAMLLLLVMFSIGICIYMFTGILGYCDT